MKMNEKNWRVIVWLLKWVDLADALVAIVTFTFYMPSWGFLLRGFNAKRRLKNLDKAREMM